MQYRPQTLSDEALLDWLARDTALPADEKLEVYRQRFGHSAPPTLTAQHKRLWSLWEEAAAPVDAAAWEPFVVEGSWQLTPAATRLLMDVYTVRGQ